MHRRLRVEMVGEQQQQSRSSKWHVEQIPTELDCEPTTVNVYVAKIDPKLANAVIRELNVKAPLPALGHVKRIRRTMTKDSLELSVILCCVRNPEAGEEVIMPTSVSEMVEKHDLQPFIVPVSENPATSREEWEAQCRLWPTSFHPNAGKADKLDQAAVDAMCSFMQMAIQVAQLGRGRGQLGNGAVIVDPGLGAVIAWGHDGTGSWCSSMGFGPHSLPTLRVEDPGRNPVECQKSSVAVPTSLPSNFLLEPGTDMLLESSKVTEGVEKCWKSVDCGENTVEKGSGHHELLGRQYIGHGFHPLRHAVMGAIDMAAARDRRLFAADRKMTDRRYAVGAEDILVSSKRPRTMEIPVENGVSSVGSFPPAQDIGNLPRIQGSEISRPYLCTGFDIYVTREPCAMCAMALVHQRFRRVIYGVPNARHGALGSRYRLHGKETLNHHYSVFKVSLSEEDLL